MHLEMIEEKSPVFVSAKALLADLRDERYRSSRDFAYRSMLCSLASSAVIRGLTLVLTPEEIEQLRLSSGTE